MNRTVAICTLLATTLVTTFPITAAAQVDEPTPEGRDWHLVSYMVDGKRHVVPAGVDATLGLEAGRAIGSAGCNGFAADYQIEGETLVFSKSGTTADTGCGDAWLDVEGGYMAALPSTATWAMDIDTGPVPTTVHGLVLYNAAGDAILEFVEPSLSQAYADVRELTALVKTQQRQIDRLTRQVAELRRQAGE